MPRRPAGGHFRGRARPFPKTRRREMRNAEVTNVTDVSDNFDNVQHELAQQDRQPGLTFKESILNGFADVNSSSSAYSYNTNIEKTYSSRNIIASNFSRSRQIESPSSSTKVNKTKRCLDRSALEHDESKRNHLKYDTMIENQDISEYIIPFLRMFGLDDVRNYTELTSDCFIRQIGDFYYCALCCQRITRIQTIDLHLAQPKHFDLFLKLRSKLLNSTPSPDSINMIALEHLTRTWLNDNLLTSAQTASRLAAVKDFSAIVAEIEPGCSCRIIGSFFVGTSLVDSDVNLELLHPNNKLFQRDPRAKSSIHHKLVDPDAEYGHQINNHTMHYDLISNAVHTLHKIAILIGHGYLPIKNFKLKKEDFCSDLSGKVPKLVLEHEPTNVTLEVWCNADSSHQLARLLRNYISLDERVSHLGILIKHWAKVCRISDPKRGTLSPETWIILVIHFLQRVQPPVLPCLHEIFCKNDDKSRKQSETAFEDATKLDETNKDIYDDNDEILGNTSRMASDLLDTNVDGVDDEIEEEAEDEVLDYDFDQDAINGLNWKSSNSDPVHKLFVDFLKFSMREFANTSFIISIRSLKRITVNDKKWNTQVKPIENPVRPSVNLAKNIGSQRTYKYIQQCFSHGYYYLTSTPMVEGLKRLAVPLPDPTGYIRLFFNLERFDFYFNMRHQKIEVGFREDLVDEMIQQGLFARDVAVIKELVEFSIFNNRRLDSIPSTLARNFDQQFLIPPDTMAANFCFLCRSFGHERDRCQRKQVTPVDAAEKDFTIDLHINFDEGFLELYVNDMIQLEISRRHLEIVQELRDAIHLGTGQDCILELFGSTVNLLGSLESDLDICMTLRDNPSGRDVKCVKILKKTCEVLSQNNHVKNIEPILAARVPIIKFKYDNFDVDLSMYNRCAIHNSKLLRSYVLIDPRVSQLCYLVKRFAKSCGIADASKGSLSSYAWSLLVIHFLQHTSPPILPVLQETNDATRPIVGVNGWNVWFDEEFDLNSLAPNYTNLTSLFKEFLLYYAEFDFNQYVISIRTSRLITKFQKNWTHCMMAIEDPFELTYNLSGRLDDSMSLYIMNSFPKAYKYIFAFQKSIRRRSQVPNADVLRFLFNGRAIMGCEPPYRGCRLCHKIGHRVKDCPEKIQKKPKNESFNNRNAEPTQAPEVREDRKDDDRHKPHRNVLQGPF